MQSKTSCFNKTLFWKHVTRFWPVWGAYLAVWVLTLPVGLLSARERVMEQPALVQQSVLNATGSGVVIAFFFAALMTMAVWSFLYNSRSASGAACLPVTRTAQFTSAALGGFVPMVGVHVVVFVLTALTEAVFGVLHLPSLLTWLAVATLVLLFFYGFATFCAMLTGNIIVLPVVYGVLNFTAAGLVVLLNGIGNWFLYGISGIAWGSFAEVMNYLSPAIPMLRGFQTQNTYALNPVTGVNELVSAHFQGWGIAAVYAVVGVLLLIAAWALLRRRRMETAGDVVAVQALKPVFRWCMGICGGLGFACIMLYLFDLAGQTQASVFAVTAVYMVIGALIAWFIAEMLIRRSFRVFRGGVTGWGGWALCCVVLLLGLTLTELDVFGEERYQPRADQIEAVAVHGDGQYAFLDSPEGIAQALEVHRGIIANKPTPDQCSRRSFFYRDDSAYGETVSVYISYILKNGRSVARDYILPHAVGRADDAAAVQALLNCREAVRHRKETPVEFTPENVRFGTVYTVMTAPECAEAAGYPDPETYVLCELGSYSRDAADAITGEARTQAVRSTLRNYYAGLWQNGEIFDTGWLYTQNVGSDDGKYDPDDPRGVDLPERPDGTPDWDGIWIERTRSLNAQDAWELYTACVVPETESGALGRVWILQTEPDYARTVCEARIDIVAEMPDDGQSAPAPWEERSVPVAAPATQEGGPSYYTFSTTMTVDAQRTAEWFAAHGLTAHARAEIYGE